MKKSNKKMLMGLTLGVLATVAVGGLVVGLNGNSTPLFGSDYEKEIAKNDIRDAVIELEKVSFDEITGVISTDDNYYHYVDEGSVKLLTFGIGTESEQSVVLGDLYDTTTKDGLIHSIDGLAEIYLYEDFIVFQTSADFKMQKTTNSFLNMSVIEYITDGLIEPVVEEA